MNSFHQIIQALQNRVMLGVARAVVTLINDDTRAQSLQLSILRREIRENVERFQNYGFTAHPHPGAEAAVVFVGGNRDHGLVIAVDDRRYRLRGLEQGEVAVYTDEGDSIVLKRGRLIEVTTQTLRVNAGALIEFNAPNIELNASAQAAINTALLAVDAPTSTFTGDVTAQGDIMDNSSGDGSSMNAMRGVYDGHTHGGVQGGPSNTAVPNQLMEP